jgi:hypothetical protein
MTMDADTYGYLMIFGRGTPASTGFLSWNGGQNQPTNQLINETMN